MTEYYSVYQRVKASPKDYDVVLGAVRENGCALIYASPDLKKDREIVMAAVRRHGDALEHAAPELKRDLQICLEAVRQKGWALRFTDPIMRENKRVVLEAVAEYGPALEYAEKKLITEMTHDMVGRQIDPEMTDGRRAYAKLMLETMNMVDAKEGVEPKATTASRAGTSGRCVVSCHGPSFESMNIAAQKKDDSCAIIWESDQQPNWRMKLVASMASSSKGCTTFIVVSGPAGIQESTQRDEVDFLKAEEYELTYMTIEEYEAS